MVIKNNYNNNNESNKMVIYQNPKPWQPDGNTNSY